MHDSLFSCPTTDYVDSNMYFTINMGFAYQQQMNVPEVIPPADFNGQLTSYEPGFPIKLKKFFSDPRSKLESLTAKPKLLKEGMQQMNHSHQVSNFRGG